jgi:hypothetical protein
MSQQKDDNSDRNWKSAITYCENLVVPPSTYSEWRLPTSKELRSIIDNSQWDPAIDSTAFPNTNPTMYWLFYHSGKRSSKRVEHLLWRWERLVLQQ